MYDSSDCDSASAGLIWAQAPPAVPGSLPKPNFSGRWHMMKEQSGFGSFHMPDIVVRTMDDHPPAINVHTVQTAGEKTTTVDITYFTEVPSLKT